MRQEIGGNIVTDFIGHWAASMGYTGILFSSSRAVELYHRYCLFEPES
jgi:hypothetical protein